MYTDRMARTRVKICGVTHPDDVRLVADVGADAIGLNFWPGSPRYVDPRRAADLIRAVPPMLDVVGVFVDLRTPQMCALAYQLGLGAIQAPIDPADLSGTFPFRRIAVFRFKDESSGAEIERCLEAARVAGRVPSAVLVDAFVEGQPGGTGKTAPWNLIRQLKLEIPLILAGGITPDNVVEAVHTVQPFAIDVASGVEYVPGRKDAGKLRRLMAEVQKA